MGQVSIAGNSYEVYGDEAGRAVYFGAALRGDVVTAASEDQQSKAHVTATRMLDRQSWFGAKASVTQDTAFPRTGLTYPSGVQLSSDEVPVEIIKATYELMISLLDGDDIESSTGSEAQVKKVKAGSAEVEFYQLGLDAVAAAGTATQVLPKTVQELVESFLRTASASSIKVAGGSVSGSDFVGNSVPKFETTG